MLIRSAFWIGEPKPTQADRLKALINEELIPAMRRFPGVSVVRALWPKDREDNSPGIYCQVIVEYASAEEMRQMMESQARADLRPQVIAAVGLFDGTLSHINYEVA
jgi:hypothetical protein